MKTITVKLNIAELDYLQALLAKLDLLNDDNQARVLALVGVQNKVNMACAENLPELIKFNQECKTDE